jgi:maleate cis-trans isomerase
MIQGHAREDAIVSGWEKKYNVSIFTSSQNQVNAMHALGVKRIVGATYLPAEQNQLFAKYFTDVGFTVLSMDGFDVPFTKVQDVPSSEILAYIRKNVQRATNPDCIYMLGSGWKTLDIIDPLEKEFGIPVLHPVMVRAWEIQKRLKIRYPKTGYGRLMATLP